MNRIFRFASLLTAAVMLFSCNGNGGTGSGNEGTLTGDFSIFTDKDVIQSNGQDAATIRVMVGDTDVTADAVIYDENNEVVNLKDGKFTTSTAGEYYFWATYGTYSTFDKNADNNGLMSIRAISVAVPEVVADPDKSKTSFVHRAFLTQYTGTGCGYCPYMIKILRELMADNTIPDKAVLAAVHSYSSADPAYIAAPKVSNYPFMHVNFESSFNHGSGSSPLYQLVNGCVATDAKAGISVNPKLYDDGTLVVRVSVKAAVDGNFRVGAWLLEDGIKGQQTDYDNIGDESFNVHDNCVRLIDSRYDGSWCGKHLGAIKAGETAEKTFVLDVKSKWKVENLHLAIIVSAEGEKGYTVCNAVDVPIDAPTPFDYK